MLKKGEFIDNRYEVLDVLGQGGMSRVYLVRDKRLDSRWVLKELIFQSSNDNEKKALEEHFMNEARMCATLSHPAIPRVIDYFSVGSEHFLVEEYIEGKTLLEMIESGHVFEKDIIPITLKLCKVLHYLHNMGIVYRDLKPDNIMIMPDSTVKLIDFGIARVYKTNRTKDTVIIGTPGFAAPEQYGLAQTDSRSDIYSLGAVMHHMVTGRDPREKPFHFETPSSMGVTISPYLEGIIMKALSLKAEERYKNIAEVVSALEAAAGEMGEKIDLSTKLLPPVQTPPVNTRVLNTTVLPPPAVTPDTPDTKKEDSNKHEDARNSWMKKIMYIIYVVVFFMLFTLLMEYKFKFWILIPYILVSWLIVAVIFKFIKK